MVNLGEEIERFFKCFNLQICDCATLTNLICAKTSVEMRNTMNNKNLKKWNIKAVLIYDGSSYDGWQRLVTEGKNKSIQYIIEDVLSNCLEEEVKITGSGRTDKGVHALYQVINFISKARLDLDILKNEVNRLLPEDIKVLAMSYASINFHSRFDAKRKTYEYRLVKEDNQSVFTRKYTYPVQNNINVDAMKKGAEYLVGTHDFKAYSTDKKDKKSTVRTIHSIEIMNVCDYTTKYKDEIRIVITGNAFLYNMVRIIVGTLVEVGEGKKCPMDVKEILESKNRSLAGTTISCQGLFLKKVDY
jgi:tRNA pseudouridine38-40 synthase